MTRILRDVRHFLLSTPWGPCPWGTVSHFFWSNTVNALPLIREYSETKVKPSLQEGKTLDIEMVYKKGSNTDDRGYYLSVREVKKEGCFVSFTLFGSPNLQLQLNTVKRKSVKAEEEAFVILKSLLKTDQLVPLLEKNGFTC